MVQTIIATNTQTTRAQNILAMLFDSVYVENILLKDELELERRGRFNTEQADQKTNTLEVEHDYRLKPNFFEDKLLASISLKEDESGWLEVYNVQGMLQGKIHLSNGKNDIDMTHLNLSNGIYLYRVWAENEVKRSDKFIKLK